MVISKIASLLKVCFYKDQYKLYQLKLKNIKRLTEDILPVPEIFHQGVKKVNLCPCSTGRTKNEKLKCCSMSCTVKYSDNTGRPGHTITLKSSLPKKFEEKTLYYCRIVL